jgi:hypothetical protein
MHAPTCELGVVHLFGLLLPDLGLVVQHIGAHFPDALAYRKVPGGKWRRIALEFEFKSSNFRLDRHDPARCHMVVCWEHDWPDCPVEVLPLKDVVQRLMRGV